MGRHNRRPSREERKLRKKKGRFVKRESDWEYPDPAKDLNDSLQRLKAEIDLTPLVSYDKSDLKPYLSPRDVLWRNSVLRFTSTFHEPIAYFGSTTSSRGLLYTQAWEVFVQDLWAKLEAMIDVPDSVEYFNAWMRRKASNAWQAANQEFVRVPEELVIEVDDVTTVAEIFEILVGSKRTEHIWWDQLVWACDYLKVQMTM